MYVIRFFSTMFFCILLVACGGGSEEGVSPDNAGADQGNNSGGPPDGPFPVSEPTNNLISGWRLNLPNGITRVSGEGNVVFSSDTYEYQLGAEYANEDRSILCFMGSELAPSSVTFDTATAQINASYGGRIVSVEPKTLNGFQGQEAVLSTTTNGGEPVTQIRRYYYIPADRNILQSGDVAIYYNGCDTFTSAFAQNESVMRSLLDSFRFVSPETSAKACVECGLPELSSGYQVQ